MRRSAGGDRRTCWVSPPSKGDTRSVIAVVVPGLGAAVCPRGTCAAMQLLAGGDTSLSTALLIGVLGKSVSKMWRRVGVKGFHVDSVRAAKWRVMFG